MKKYIRSTTNGLVFDYSERMASLPDVVVITEEEAFPERFAPVKLNTRTKKVDITVAKEATVPPVEVAPELIAEASKPFGTPKATRIYNKAPVSTTPASFSGLEGEL